MISEKVVVALMIAAIVLSATSVIITMSMVSMKLGSGSQINIIQGKTDDSQQGKVSIVITPPENPPEAPKEK